MRERERVRERRLVLILSYRLSTPPLTLDALGDSIRLLEQMQNQVPQVERQFEPLQDQFNMLDKHEVTIPEEVRKFTKLNIIYFRIS